MKLNRLSCLVLAMMLWVAASALADHPNDHPSEHPTDQAAEMEAWLAAGTPGEVHAFLATKAGNWTVENKMWMDPRGEPTVSENTATFEMMMGGRFLVESVSGMTMGMPFEGMNITGFNNTTSEMTSVWYDNMGTVTTVLSGAYENIGEPMVLTGTTMDPLAGMEVKIRTVTTYVSDDETLFEYFVTSGTGDEMKMMELRYKRDK